MEIIMVLDETMNNEAALQEAMLPQLALMPHDYSPNLRVEGSGSQEKGLSSVPLSVLFFDDEDGEEEEDMDEDESFDDMDDDFDDDDDDFDDDFDDDDDDYEDEDEDYDYEEDVDYDDFDE